MVPVRRSVRMRPGTRIDGRYVVERPIGRGAMGSVLLARDEGLDRRVAIKVVDAHARVPDHLARFRAEAAALARIRHDRVVQVHAAGEHEGQLFFVMEYVEGRDLERSVLEHLTNDEWVPLPRAISVLEQAAEGLHAIHVAGHVHRDVKPANIVIEEATGRTVVVDLGLAASLADLARGEPVLGVGTPAYAAPENIGERLDPHRIGPRSDVYSLACTAFEVFAGRPPFLGPDRLEVATRQRDAAPPRLSQYRPELAALDEPLGRALAKDPAARPSSAPQLVRSLRQALGLAAEPPGLLGRDPLDDVLRILMVDDDEDFLALAGACTRAAFADTPVQMEMVTSGGEALERVATFRPHLLLLDYRMPGLNGIETLTRIRAMPFGEAVRVVVISSTRQEWRFSVLGVHDFIGKGESPAALTRALRDVARRYFT